MKVAYFAESPADQAALTILTEAILDKQTETISHSGLRHRGWPKVAAVLMHLHYLTDAEGFVFIVGSDKSQPHLREHDLPNEGDPRCRLCQLRHIADEVRTKMRPRQNLRPLSIALGLAVPAIEAWLLCGVNPHVSEGAWMNGLKEDRFPFTGQSLKTELYGTSHPSLEVETAAMKKAATRLTSNLRIIEKLFPYGFGALLRSLKSW